MNPISYVRSWRPVPYIRQFWRLHSIQAMGVAMAIQTTYAGLPEGMQQAIPHAAVAGLTSVVLGLGVVGRLVRQDTVTANVSNQSSN